MSDQNIWIWFREVLQSMLEDWQWRHLCYDFGQCVPYPQSRNLKGPATDCEMLEGNWCLLTVINGGKIKGAILLTGELAVCSSPFCKPLSLEVDRSLSLWMARVLPDLWLPSQPEGIITLWSAAVATYTAWWQRHVCMCVWATCLRLLPESGTAGCRTATLWVLSPTS